MIGETTSYTSTVQSERIARENSGGETTRKERDGEVSQQDISSDTVSLSAEAVALARNVPPASESSEIPEDNGSGQQSDDPAERIDIRA